MEYPIRLEIEYPDRLSRLTTFFRILMLIPHLIVLIFIEIAALVLLFIAWWAVLITGRYPAGLFNFIAGYFRWGTRVSGYTFLLTDKYPPFSMS